MSYLDKAERLARRLRARARRERARTRWAARRAEDVHHRLREEAPLEAPIPRRRPSVREAPRPAAPEPSAPSKAPEPETIAQLLDRAEKLRRSVTTTLNEMDATETRIDEERQPVLEQLEEIKGQIEQIEAQSDKQRQMIEEKEKQIDEKLEAVTTRDFGSLGSYEMPDANALRKAAELTTEVAGLYGLLAVAKQQLGPLIQGRIALEEAAVLNPVEADSRIAELQQRLDEQNAQLDDLNDQILELAVARFEAVFTDAEKRALAEKLARRVETRLDEQQEAELFYDAIRRVERVLIASTPETQLGLLRSAEGLEDESAFDVEGLIEKLEGEVEIEGIRPEAKTRFFRALLELLQEGIRKDLDLGSAVSRME